MAEVMQSAVAVEADAAAAVDDGRTRKRLGIGFWVAVVVLSTIVLGCIAAPHLGFLKDPRIPDGRNSQIVA